MLRPSQATKRSTHDYKRHAISFATLESVRVVSASGHPILVHAISSMPACAVFIVQVSRVVTDTWAPPCPP